MVVRNLFLEIISRLNSHTPKLSNNI